MGCRHQETLVGYKDTKIGMDVSDYIFDNPAKVNPFKGPLRLTRIPGRLSESHDRRHNREAALEDRVTWNDDMAREPVFRKRQL